MILCAAANTSESWMQIFGWRWCCHNCWGWSVQGPCCRRRIVSSRILKQIISDNLFTVTWFWICRYLHACLPVSGLPEDAEVNWGCGVTLNCRAQEDWNGFSGYYSGFYNLFPVSTSDLMTCDQGPPPPPPPPPPPGVSFATNHCYFQLCSSTTNKSKITEISCRHMCTLAFMFVSAYVCVFPHICVYVYA